MGDSTVVGGCYLLHFATPVLGKQHYLGWTVDLDRRMRVHLAGRGARLVKQALKADVGVELVRVWSAADRKQERALKKHRAPKSYCPRCNAAKRKSA